MKFTCKQKELAFALSVVNKAISPNNTLPVLNNILLKAEGKKVYFTATNLEIAINYFFEADVINEGKITIPSKLFTNYVNLLNDEDIELKVEEGLNLSIKSKKSNTKIKGISAEEFPIIPDVDKEYVFKIKTNILREAIHQTVFAASSNISRPVLSGVLFKITEDKLNLVATDSYRLAEKIIKLDKKMDDDMDCIIPSRTVGELGKILTKYEDEEVELNVSKNQIQFSVDNIILTSRLIEGKFPDYEKIIPTENKTRVEVSIEDFVLAVKKVSLFAEENNYNIKLNITNDGKILILTDETQIGEEKAEVEGKVSGDNNKIAVNAQYLQEVLNNIGGDTIIFEMSDKLLPAVIKPIKEGGYTHIIMPLKL